MCRELTFTVNLFFLFIDSMSLDWKIAEYFGPATVIVITAGLILSIRAVRLESLLTALLSHLAPNVLRLEKNREIFLFCSQCQCKLHILKCTVACKLYRG